MKLGSRKLKPGKVYPNRVVIFLDILGFSHACSTETWQTIGPEKAQSDYEALVSMVYGSNSVLADGPSWEAYFALSDSVFLTSPEPDVALFAAATVLYAIYCFSHERGIPAMVRGGIGYGEIMYDIDIHDIGSTSPNVGNLYGPAVVEAVQLEKSGAGPRLFCSSHFPVNELGGIAQNMLTFAPETNCYEVLWAALSKLTIREVRKVFRAAWHAYAKAATWAPSVRRHYVEGLCFAIRCLSHYYETPRHRKNNSFEKDVRDLIRPATNFIFQMEDWLRVDEVIRWELKEQEQARHEFKVGLQGVKRRGKGKKVDTAN